MDLSATEHYHGPNIESVVYGDAPPQLDDPAEGYFEASKLHRSSFQADMPGVTLLQNSSWLIEATSRAGKRFAHAPAIDLPEPTYPGVSLGEAVGRRRSPDAFAPAPLALGVLATLLHATYGVTATRDGHGLRAAASAGGLYPLDLYVAADGCPELAGGLHHYEPGRHRLARVGDADQAALAHATMQPPAFEGASAVLVLCASFWRSRFKYGQRALRFALMEAGHAGQNLLLAATALGLAGRCIGGFADDEVGALIGCDGVNEAPLYVIAVGVPDGPVGV